MRSTKLSIIIKLTMQTVTRFTLSNKIRGLTLSEQAFTLQNAYHIIFLVPHDGAYNGSLYTQVNSVYHQITTPWWNMQPKVQWPRSMYY